MQHCKACKKAREEKRLPDDRIGLECFTQGLRKNSPAANQLIKYRTPYCTYDCQIKVRADSVKSLPEMQIQLPQDVATDVR